MIQIYITKIYIFYIFFFSVTCLASKSVCAFLPKDVTDGIGYLTNIMSNKSGKARSENLMGKLQF